MINIYFQKPLTIKFGIKLINNRYRRHIWIKLVIIALLTYTLINFIDI